MTIMQNAPLVPDYDQNEERINYISHGVGAGLSIVAGILLIIKGSYLSTGQWIGLWVYVNRHSNRQSSVFIDCTLGDCPSWYTFQVRFHSSFPETFFGGLSGHGLAGAAGD